MDERSNLDMAPVLFSKARAMDLLECVQEGNPIVPGEDEGWTMADMLVVAGVLTCTAGTHFSPTGKNYKGDDLLAAVEFISNLAEQVLDDTYDVDFEQNIIAGIRRGEDGVGKVQVVKAYKGK